MKHRLAAPLLGDPMPRLQWIEVASSLQLPNLHIIGLPSPEISEARDRIRAAIESSDLEFPKRRVVVNLSPANIKKKGTSSDLAMALGILWDSQNDHSDLSHSFVASGELGLNGNVKAAAQLTRLLFAAWAEQIPYVMVSEDEHPHALAKLQWLRQARSFSHPPPQILGAATLKEAWALFKDTQGGKKYKVEIELPSENSQVPNEPPIAIDTSELMPLQPYLQRILGIAAAGSHHLLLLGPKGVGKTHALEWLARIQPSPSPQIFIQQALLDEMRSGETSASPSIHGRVPVRRAPPQIKPAALIGSLQGGLIRPGELSLAHGGLLIADEFPEWHRDAREALREPMERGKTTLSRAAGRVELNAEFLFAATGNLCPCGGWPAEIPKQPEAKVPPCRCTPAARTHYLSRISGPILDRIDVCALITGTPTSKNQSLNFDTLREKTLKTRLKLIKNWGNPPQKLVGSELERLIQQNGCWNRELENLNYASKRARHKTLKVALTLAAWDGGEAPTDAHWMEAHLFRADRFLNL